MKLNELLEKAYMTPEFRAAVLDFRVTGRPNAWIVFGTESPAVKVERALTKLLESYPEAGIERVELSARSGCEFFRGRLRFQAADGAYQVRFHWDCKWRAMQEGWIDYFGFPDQMRAAREFGYDCFREWTEEATPEAALPA